MMKTISILFTAVVLSFSISYGQISFSFSTNTNTNTGKKNKEDKNKNQQTNNSQNQNNSSLQADATFDPEYCSIKITPTNNSYSVDVKVRVMNTKTKVIPTGVKLSYYLTRNNTGITESDQLLAVYELPEDLCANCYAGYSYNFNLAYKDFKLTEAGNYYMALRLDEDGKVEETDEANNDFVINTLIEYTVPEGVIEYNNYQAQENIKNEFKKNNAGKILFGLGPFDYNDPSKNTYVTSISMKDLVATTGTEEYGEELSFYVIYKRSLKDQFEIFRNQGLDKKAWPTEANWVNLTYQITIDGKDSVMSAAETDILSFKKDVYSRWLTGKNATGGKLPLQTVLLEKLYGMSTGEHKVKIQAFVQSAEAGKKQTGPEAIAEGEFTVSITTEDKINHFKKYNDLKPLAKMKNSTLEGQMKQFIVSYYAETEVPISLTDIKYFTITEAEWTYEKSFTGEILSRSIYTHSLVQYKNGTCGYIWMQIGEDYKGGGSYSNPSFSSYTTGGCVPCEALK